MIKACDSYLESDPTIAHGEEKDTKQNQIDSLKSEKKIIKMSTFQKSYLYQLMGLKFDEFNSLEDKDENVFEESSS